MSDKNDLFSQDSFGFDEILESFDPAEKKTDEAPEPAPLSAEEPAAPVQEVPYIPHEELFFDDVYSAFDAEDFPEDEEEPYAPVKEKKPSSHREVSKAREFFFRFCGGIFAAVSVLALLWMTVNVHPDTHLASTKDSSRTRTNIVSKVSRLSQDAKDELFGDIQVYKKEYKIDESALVAPVPDPVAFGESFDIEVIKRVIERAEKSQLLEGQTLVFNPDAEFYFDEPIKYYFDESLLVICWKEMIDGRVCSCAEIKAADASQFRRKISEDTYGSPVKVYASQLSAQTNAVVAMNADLYLQRDLGITVYRRQVYRFNEWLYTGKYNQYNAVDNLFIDENGDFIFMHKGEQTSKETVQRVVDENNILFSLAFGPILVENGQLKECDWYPCGEIREEYSRAGLGQVDKLHYLYMSVNHSYEGTPRCNIDQFAAIMYGKGVKNAYALDGGQTAELVFNHEPYNYIDFGSERAVSDIIYFASAVTR